MVYINKHHLVMVSHILRCRFNRPTSLGGSIIDPILSSPTKLNDHFDPRIGFFHRRPNGHPVFLLFDQDQPSESEDDVASVESSASDQQFIFAFYVESGFKSIQSSEMKTIKNFAPKIDLSKFRLGVVDVQTDTPRFCMLSILLHALEIVDGDLFSNFSEYKRIIIRRGSSLVCLNKTLANPPCQQDKDWLNSLKSSLELYSVSILDSPAQASTIPSDFDLLVAKFKNHFIYAIQLKSERVISVLLPHLTQFRSQEDLERFTKPIESAIGKRKFIAARYLGEYSDSCQGKHILQFILLLLGMRPNAMTIVRDVDIHGLEIISESQEIPVQFEDAGPSHMDYQMDLSPSKSDITIEVDVEGSVIVSKSNHSSQETEIYSQSSTEDEVARIVDYLMRREQAVKRLKLGFPLVGLPGPNNDPTGRIMHDIGTFESVATGVIELFDAFSDTVLLPTMNTTDIINGTRLSLGRSRYFVQPFLDDDEEIYSLMILDAKNHEWIYMSPENGAIKSREVFDILKGQIEDAVRDFGEFTGRPVMMTSHFHQSWPKLHLLMGLQTVCSLLRLANRLPVKIIYQERDFRRLCWSFRIQQEFVNKRYNLENGFVKPDGSLTSDAYISPVFILPVVHAVVPKDQCMFCKMRGFKNLSRHIMMKHTTIASQMVNMRRDR